MRIAIAQARGQMDDPPANASKAKMLLLNTDVDLLIFPEMFATGMDKNCPQFAPNLNGLFKTKAYKFVKEERRPILYGSPVQYDDGLYNCAILTDGENEQIYRKIHLSANEKFDEKELFKAGNEPKIFDFHGLRIGMAIGRDLMFNELFRWYSAQDVDIVICIAAVSKQSIDQYEKMLPARCVDNSLEIIFVNMVGPDPGFVLAGGSRYVSYEGNVLERCTDSSDVRVIKLDAERIKKSKENRKFLQEIRKDIDWSV